jgi:hypothetical protein
MTTKRWTVTGIAMRTVATVVIVGATLGGSAMGPAAEVMAVMLASPLLYLTWFAK